MCCDICPGYDECEENDKLKDKCCPECTDYGYCKENSEREGIEDDSEDNGKKFRNHY